MSKMLVTLLMLVIVVPLAACGGGDTPVQQEPAADVEQAVSQQADSQEAADESAEETAPTDVPPTEEPPTEVPPTDVPPTDVPPTEVPPTEEPATEVPPTEAEASDSETGVTLANFNKLQNGMSYAEVVAILGRDGTVLSESDIAGFHTVMYSWEADKGILGANMNAMFQNGELVQKAQFGLQ